MSLAPTRSRHRGALRASLAVSAAAFLAYLYTAAPEPDWIDSGELAVAAHTLGIAHSTPKVLYVLLARLSVVVLPGPFFPLICLGAMSVSAGLCLFVLSARHLTACADKTTWLLPGAILMAASPLVWQQATSNEVHALQFLLFTSALYLWARPEIPNRHLGITYVFCLSILNHGTAIFLFPLWAAVMWRSLRDARVWMHVVATAVLGLSLVLFLPIRSGQLPLLDWDHTADPVGFWHHLTGWSYQGWMGRFEWTSLGPALARFWHGLRDGFPGPVLLLAAIGLWRLFAIRPAAFLQTLAVALLCVGVASSYTISDIDDYFLAAHVMLALWTCVALVWLATKNRHFAGAAAVVVLLSVVWSTVEGWPGLNKRGFRVPTDWVRDAMETVDSGGVVLTSDWDHYSPWMYLRVVEHFRTDAVWINMDLLRQSWYPDFLRQVAPERFSNARVAVDSLVAQVQAFEAGRPFDDSTVEAAFAKAVAALTWTQPGPVYADGVAAPDDDWGVERIYLQGTREVPWGLLTRLLRAGEPSSELPAWPKFRNDSVERVGSYRTLFHLELYERARFERSRYELKTR